MRLFISIDPPDSIKSELLLLINQLGSITGVRWLPSEGLHLTLKFLGSVSEPTREQLNHSLLEVAQDFPVMNFRFSAGGVFPHRHNPKVFWMGLTGEINSLERLVASIEARLIDLGFPKEEKRFWPHLTIGRTKPGVSRKESVTEANLFCKLTRIFRSTQFMVKDFHLVQSHLQSNGAYYEKRASYQLGNS